MLIKGMSRIGGHQTAFVTMLLGALVLFPSIALALTPAGTAIPNAGSLNYQLGMTGYSLVSGTSTVTVNAVHDIDIQPPLQGAVQPGKSVSYTHTVTNKSNVADTIDIEPASSLGLGIELFASDGTPLKDTDGDGKPDTGLLAPGTGVSITIKLTAQPAVAGGLIDSTIVRAVSSADPSVRPLITDQTTVLSPQLWDPLVKTVEPPGKVTPATILTYTNTFGNTGNTAADNVVITDLLDPNLIYIPGSATLPAGLSGASVGYDASARTVTWTIPQVPAGYVGKISFRSQIGPATPCDTVVTNRISIISDQTPDPQYSNTVSTTVTEQPLRIYKSANKAEVEVGDYVEYTVRVENVSKGTTAVQVSISDQLPKGFRYINGSSFLDGEKIDNPDGGTNPVWFIGSLPPGTSRILTYRTIVSISAPMGTGKNRASAGGKSPGGTAFSAGPAVASVKIKEGVLNGKIIILGRVFIDLNSNKMPDEDEPGIKGVRIYLEDGSYAITDGDGKYSFDGISADDHILKIDKATIPAGYTSVPLNNTFGGDGGSQFVSAPFGGLVRGDFGLAGDGKEKPKESLEKQSQTATPPMMYTFGTESTPAPATLEQQILTMPETPDIIEPADGKQLNRNWCDIVVRVPGNRPYTVTVNGIPLLEKQIGKKITESKRNILIAQYVGIKLDPGENMIILETTTRDNTVVTREHRVIVAGAVAKITLSPAKTDLIADGKSTVSFTVMLLDKEGRPASGEEAITVQTEKGIIVEPDIDPLAPGHQIKVHDGKAVITLRGGLKTGQDTLRVSLGSMLQATADIFFLPEMRDWIVAGIGSVLLSGKLASGNLEGISETDNFEQGIYNNNRLAFFLKGKILGKYLLTAAYDSEKHENNDELFRQINPERYYPIYGDASERGYEAESRGKLYVKLEQGRSSILYGDYHTGLTATEFSRYDRALHGVKADIEVKNVSVKAFESSTSQTMVRDEIPGNGTSGYYFLRKKPLIENSEKIRIEVRDRYHTEQILSAVEKARYTDYTIDYRNGTILFKEPVPTLDPDLNPVLIIVFYESNDSNDEYYIYGGRAAVRTGNGSEVGVTAVVEQKELKDASIYGADTTIKIGEKTVVKGEAAWSDTYEAGKGQAWKMEVLTEVINRMILGAYYRDIGEHFRNPSMSNNEPGTTKYGLKLGYALSDKTGITAEAYRQENSIADSTLTEASLGVSRKFALWSILAGYRYVSEQIGSEPEKSSQQLFAGVSGNITKRLTVSVLRDQSLTSSVVEKYPTRTLLKMDYLLTEKIKLFLTQEFQETTDGNRNISLFGIETRLWKNIVLNTGYQIENGSPESIRRAIVELNTTWGSDKGFRLTTRTGYEIENALSAYRGKAILGLNTRWQILDGLTVSSSAERIQPTQGDNREKSTAFAIAAEYLKRDDLKLSGRYELKLSESEDTHLISFGGALRLSRSLSLLGKLTWWNSAKDAGTDTLLDGMVGVAYRPLGKESLYLLSYMKYLMDKKGSTPSDDSTTNLITSTEINYRISPRLTIMGKYAGKLSWENTSGKRFLAYTDMLMGGATIDLTDRIDVSVYGKVMNQYQAGMTAFGSVVSVGYRVMKNLRVIAGYNFSKFNDRELSGEGYMSQGPFVTTQFKFDEGTFVELCEKFLGACRKPAKPVIDRTVEIKSEKKDQPVDVLGSVEALTLLVNEHEVQLPSGDIAITNGAVDDVIEIKGDDQNKRVAFSISVDAPANVGRWTLEIRNLSGEVLRSFAGEGAPPENLEWDCRAGNNEPLPGGGIYEYQLRAENKDGSWSTSPVRLFGLDRASAVGIKLGSRSFQARSVTLTADARQALHDTAAILRKYPKEKIIIEGRSDPGGPEEATRDLIRKRCNAAADYLIREGNIPAERIIVRSFGMSVSDQAGGQVEIRGESRYSEKTVILDRHRAVPYVKINRTGSDIDDMGRFSKRIEEPTGAVAVEMGDSQGRSLLTSVSLPSLVLLDPPEKQFPYEPAEGAESKIPFTVKGRTDAGNTMECDGKPVPIGDGGLFMLKLDLRDGENSFWLKATSPDGYTRHAQLRISVAFKTVARPAEEAKRKETFLDKIVNMLLEMKLIDIGKETSQ